MSMVQQTPDQLLIVRVGSQVYMDTYDNAASDYGFATPMLAAGATDRVYDQGIRHAQTNGVDIVLAGPIPWSTGDAYIANIAAALAAQSARPKPQPPTPPGRRKNA
jgi:hypothetical protein